MLTKLFQGLVQVPAFPPPGGLVDTLGAGDTFNATVITAPTGFFTRLPPGYFTTFPPVYIITLSPGYITLIPPCYITRLPLGYITTLTFGYIP